MILVIALISTFSTTGYSMFILIIILYFYNGKNKYKWLLSPLLIGASISLFSLPFMYDKFTEVSNHDIDQQIESSILYDKKITMQRVTSFTVDFQDFKNNPVLGYAGHQNERWTSKLGANVSTTSGIGKVFGQYGLIGVIFFFILLYKSSKMLTLIFNFKGWVFPFLLIVMTSISYSLIFNPLIMCVWMSSLFLPKVKTLNSAN